MERFYLQMHITNKCNNRCKHCYQHNYEGEDMSFTQSEKVLVELSNMCKRINVESHVSITGGDPLLSKDFWKILVKAKEICNRVGILGNPEMLTKRAVKNLFSAKVDFYQLSLDGLLDAHDCNRYKGSFDKTCRAIKNLSEAGIDVYINMTLMNENRSQLSAVQAIAIECGAYYFSWDECVPDGEDCQVKSSCSLGHAAMTILPDMSLMACRRTPSSLLGTWSVENGLEENFVNHKKMKEYRTMNNACN